jgi:hypothetical protein
MKLVRVAWALTVLAFPAYALLARPAFAQMMPNINLIPDIQSKTPEEKEADKEKDKAYKESLRKIPDAKTSKDPWGGVRSSDAPKTVTTPGGKKTAASKRTKTGSNAN